MGEPSGGAGDPAGDAGACGSTGDPCDDCDSTEDPSSSVGSDSVCVCERGGCVPPCVTGVEAPAAAELPPVPGGLSWNLEPEPTGKSPWKKNVGILYIFLCRILVQNISRKILGLIVSMIISIVGVNTNYIPTILIQMMIMKKKNLLA
jgi:hypothetical protein